MSPSPPPKRPRDVAGKTCRNATKTPRAGTKPRGGGESSPARGSSIIWGRENPVGGDHGNRQMLQHTLTLRTALLLVPLVGLTCSGRSANGINVRSAVGGIALELYQRIGRHSGKEYADYFEPQVARDQLNALVAEVQIPVQMRELIDRKAGGQKDGRRITVIPMLTGNTYRGRAFIDASYTGDLMLAAGASHAAGRELEQVRAPRRLPPSDVDASVKQKGRNHEHETNHD